MEVYVACSACAQAGISFYHSYMYIFHINHVSSKDEIKTWGPLALSGPASLRSTSAHAQVMMAHILTMIEKVREIEGLRRVAEGHNHKLVKES